MAVAQAPTSNVSSDDRLGFALFLALAIHAVFLLGVSFSHEELSKSSPTLEITLAQFKSDQAPDKADFASQFNQEGSGTEEEKKQLTTEEFSAFNDTEIHEVTPEQEIKAQIVEQQTDKNLVTTISKSDQITPIAKEAPEPEPDPLEGNAKTQTELSQEIASMEARLDRQRQKDARRPRIRRLTSVASKQSVDALYLYDWRNKVEIVGNLYYPEKARREQIFGSLQLMVALLPSGKIFEIKVLNTSGYKVLDDAAIETVKRAAPFDPFPPELSAEVDRLEIIRTWRFDRDNQMTAE